MKTIGIIGLGAAAGHIHLPAYRQLADRVRVTAGCDPDAAARTRAQREWKIPAVYETADEMLAAAKPDIVAVCTPPWLHCEHLLASLGAGCHVFCEKPLADDLETADRMVRAADASGRLVAINNQFPFMNIHQAAKQAIGTPEFGRLLHLHAWHTMRTTAVTEAGWRGKMSRRLCLEFGVHVLDLARFFFGQNPSRVMASMPNPFGRSGCDAFNAILLEFPGGRGASLVLDRLSQGPERYLDMHLDGESATVHTSIGGRVRLELGVHTRIKRPFFNLSFVKGGQAVLERGTNRRVLAQDGINPFADGTRRHFANFLDSIERGTQPPAHIRDNRDTLALVLAAYESAESGRWIVPRYAAPAVEA